MVIKLLNHIERWNIWRKHNTNSKIHHLLVLLGVIKSPTMCFVYTKAEQETLYDYYKNLK